MNNIEQEEGTRLGLVDEPELWLNLPNLVDERNHPNHWFNRASDLHAAAGAIWYAMGSKSVEVSKDLNFPPGFSMSVACWPVYHMLCGLALEVIMKAVLVLRKTPPKKYEQHGLNILTNLLELKPSADEEKLLDFYNASLVWAGRYPTPKRATDNKLKEYWGLASDVLTSPCTGPSPYGISIRRGNNSTDWSEFTSLWQRYASLFDHELAARHHAASE